MTESEEEDDAEKFNLELTASEMYSLASLLHWSSMEVTGPQNKMVAQSLAKSVHDVMASERFDDVMEDEMEEMREKVDQPPAQLTDMDLDFNGRGVQ